MSSQRTRAWPSRSVAARTVGGVVDKQAIGETDVVTVFTGGAEIQTAAVPVGGVRIERTPYDVERVVALLIHRAAVAGRGVIRYERAVGEDRPAGIIIQSATAELGRFVCGKRATGENVRTATIQDDRATIRPGVARIRTVGDGRFPMRRDRTAAVGIARGAPGLVAGKGAIGHVDAAVGAMIGTESRPGGCR